MEVQLNACETDKAKGYASATQSAKNVEGADNNSRTTTTSNDAANTISDQSPGTSSEVQSIIQQSMELNVAYEALEHIRQANTTIEFGREVGSNECIPCLREQLKQPEHHQQRRRFARTKRIVSHRLKSALPCLTCGYQVCTQHRFPELARQNIIICTECAQFFSLHFVADASDLPQQERSELMNHMLDVYDRAWLILKYSSQFIEEISAALQESTKSKDKVGLGSSASGFFGGVVGVAGALTIFTPAGPPLLLASILFGSAGAATSARSEAAFNRSSANRAADTIITVHGMLQSLSMLSRQYRHEQAAIIKLAAADGQQSSTEELEPNNNEYQNANRKNWARATANVLKPLTLGVLSAASVVLEAREMKTTVEKIKNGSPCSKAAMLYKIAQDVDSFPLTKSLSEECQHFFI